MITLSATNKFRFLQKNISFPFIFFLIIFLVFIGVEGIEQIGALYIFLLIVVLIIASIASVIGIQTENDLLKVDIMKPNRHFQFNIDEGLNLYVNNEKLYINNIKYAIPLFIRDRDFGSRRVAQLNPLEVNLIDAIEIQGEKFTKLFFIEKEYAFKFLKKDTPSCLETLVRLGLTKQKIKSKVEKVIKQIFIPK
jgi:hypothetical protein